MGPELECKAKLQLLGRRTTKSKGGPVLKGKASAGGPWEHLGGVRGNVWTCTEGLTPRCRAACKVFTWITSLIQASGLPSRHFFFEFYFIYFFTHKVLISHLFYTHQCIHVNPNRPIHHTTTTTTPHRFPPLVAICLFSTSVSQFLPCKPVHLYHCLGSTHMR